MVALRWRALALNPQFVPLSPCDSTSRTLNAPGQSEVDRIRWTPSWSSHGSRCTCRGLPHCPSRAARYTQQSLNCPRVQRAMLICIREFTTAPFPSSLRLQSLCSFIGFNGGFLVHIPPCTRPLIHVPIGQGDGSVRLPLHQPYFSLGGTSPNQDRVDHELLSLYNSSAMHRHNVTTMCDKTDNH